MREKDRLKAENFAMKAEIIANNGILSDLSDLSPEIENQFLKHILDIEREPDTRIGDLLPEFRYEKDLLDNEVGPELDRLIAKLEKKQIQFELPTGLPIRMAYRYLTEELIDEKITVPMSKNSHLHLDACSGWCPDCFVVDYCETVHEIWSPEELEKERGKVGRTN